MVKTIIIYPQKPHLPNPNCPEKLSRNLYHCSRSAEKNLTGIEITASGLQLLCQAADGDARVALNSLELAVSMASGLKIWDEVGGKVWESWRMHHKNEGLDKVRCILCIMIYTLPETNIAPENGMKTDGWKMNFLLAWPIFRGELLVSGSVYIWYALNWFAFFRPFTVNINPGCVTPNPFHLGDCQRKVINCYLNEN